MRNAREDARLKTKKKREKEKGLARGRKRVNGKNGCLRRFFSCKRANNGVSKRPAKNVLVILF